MNAELVPFCARNMPLVTTLSVLINASVTRVGQVMDKPVLTLTNARLVCIRVWKIRTAQITKGVTLVRVTEDGNVSGLSPMVDVPAVIQNCPVLAMDSVCEMERATVLAITVDRTAPCAGQTSAARAMEPATLMGTVTVNMAGQDSHWTVVFAHQKRCAVATECVTTT